MSIADKAHDDEAARLHPHRSVSLTVIRKAGRHTTPHQRSHEPGRHDDHATGHDGHVNPHNAAKTRTFTTRIPAGPLTLQFAKRRWKSGVKSLLGSVAAVATGAFLASQISTTPAIRVQVVIVSGVCIVGGLVLLYLAIRDLLGRLRVDSHGIRLSPAYLGFSIPWTDLYGWEVDGLAFGFSTARSEHTYSAEQALLSDADGAALSALLNSCVPEKRMKLNHGK